MALSDNLVSYWKLDESSGNAADSVGSNALTNNNTVGYGDGKINNGADFGSSNTNKSLYFNDNKPPSSIVYDSSYTISYWIKVTTAPGTGVGMCLHSISQSANPGFHERAFYYDIGGEKRIYVQSYRSTNSDAVYSVTTLTTGTWYHLCYVYDSSVGGKYYLNTDLIVTNPVTGGENVSTTKGLTFGIQNDLTSNPFSGMIDEIGIWSRVLSGAEISELYKSGAGNQYPFPTTNIKTVNGLAQASVKTVNGLAIASVKSIMGLS
jgi:hypothetical protein